MSRVNRRAQRRDENEPEIVSALRSAGATVEMWDVVDLVVGYRNKTYLLEVTNPDRILKSGKVGARDRERKQKQADWRRVWMGHAVEVTNVSGALEAIGAIDWYKGVR